MNVGVCMYLYLYVYLYLCIIYIYIYIYIYMDLAFFIDTLPPNYIPVISALLRANSFLFSV